MNEFNIVRLDQGVSNLPASIGGLCGGIESTTILNCYNLCRVHGKIPSGGICGAADAASKLTNCYSAGFVEQLANHGGLYAETGIECTTETSYWDSDNAWIQTSPGGTGLTTELLITQVGTGWSELIWTFEAGYYPRLAMQQSAEHNALPVPQVNWDYSDGYIRLWWDAPTVAPISYGIYYGEEYDPPTLVQTVLEANRPTELNKLSIDYTSGDAQRIYVVANYDKYSGTNSPATGTLSGASLQYAAKCVALGGAVGDLYLIHEDLAALSTILPLMEQVVISYGGVILHSTTHVGTWINIVEGMNFAQATDINRPLINDGGSLRVLRFDGSNDVMSYSNASNYVLPYEIVYGINALGAGETAGTMFLASLSGVGSYNGAYLSATNKLNLRGTSNNNYGDGSFKAPGIYVVRWPAGVSVKPSAWRNGLALGELPATGAGQTCNTYQIFSGSYGALAGDALFFMKTADGIALTEGQRIIIEDWAFARFGIGSERV